jgi:hypothetical protein
VQRMQWRLLERRRGGGNFGSKHYEALADSRGDSLEFCEKAPSVAVPESIIPSAGTSG